MPWHSIGSRSVERDAQGWTQLSMASHAAHNTTICGTMPRAGNVDRNIMTPVNAFGHTRTAHPDAGLSWSDHQSRRVCHP